MSPSNSKPQIAILLAAERTGTHLLRSYLFSVPGVSAPAEICNPAAEKSETGQTLSWFNFVKASCLKDESLFTPTRENRERMLDAYLDHVREFASDRNKSLIVLDVKYSHLGNFESHFSDPLDRPLLLQYAEQKNIRIVHLVRRKAVTRAISQAYARSNGVYVAMRGADVPLAPITLDRQRLIYRAKEYAQRVAQVGRWLKLSNHFTIEYEQISAAPPQLRFLAEFLGLAAIPVKSTFKKTTPPYEKSIANFHEIEDLIGMEIAELM